MLGVLEYKSIVSLHPNSFKFGNRGNQTLFINNIDEVVHISSGASTGHIKFRIGKKSHPRSLVSD